jgi:transposase
MTEAPSTAPPASLPEAQAALVRLEQENQQLRWQVQQLKKQLYGPSADKAPAPESYAQEQRLLDVFPERGEPPATQDVVLPPDQGQEPAPRRRSARRPQPKVLETVTERIEPQEKLCPHCGQPKCEIGCERSERLEYIPAKLIRHEIIRPKLACRCGQGTVAIAPLPASVIEKGKPGPGLLSQVVLTKYDDHVPLYRQQQQFERLGVSLARSTLSDWVARGAEWLQPIVRCMKQELLAGDYLQVDETPVRVLDPEVKGQSAKGYLWVAGRPGGDVLFEFHPGRGTQDARELLGGFRGYLQRDGYGVYGSLSRAPDSGLKPCGCLAHARRKFVEALADEPTEAQWFVGELRKLYRIEGHARTEGLTAEQRYRLRQQLAPPIWAGLKSRLEQIGPTLLPQSPLGKAVKYALAEWEPLQTYLQEGRLEIDNNLTENAIRPSAVGKKNYLFIGHPQAGWRSAVIYSVIVSCRRRQIDPWTYLKDVFTRLPNATNQQIADFVPARWQPAQAAA